MAWANAQSAALGLTEFARKFGQILRAAGRPAEHRQQINGQQRPKGIGPDPRAILGGLLEAIDDRIDFFGRVARARPDLGFDHGQRGLELLGLQTASGITAKLPHQ